MILVLEKPRYVCASSQLVNIENGYAYVLEYMLIRNDKVRVSIHQVDSDDLDFAVKISRTFNCHFISPCTPWLRIEHT